MGEKGKVECERYKGKHEGEVGLGSGETQGMV